MIVPKLQLLAGVADAAAAVPAGCFYLLFTLEKLLLSETRRRRRLSCFEGVTPMSPEP